MSIEQTISDNIIKAVDVIVDQKLSELEYNTTIEATIIDNSGASEGRYKVLYGASRFDAYTKDTTLEKGDVVQVQIPNNDTNKTKIILGKVASSTGVYITETPFSKYIDVTGNLIDPNSVIIGNKQLVANGDKQEKLIFETIGNSNYLTDYTKIGLEAKFSSRIPSAETGEYGLRIEISSDSLVTDYIIEYTLNTDDMSGNPYDYVGFNSFQKVFDLSSYNLAGINNIAVYFYQEKNSFLSDADDISSLLSSKDSFNNTLPANLFVDDVYLSFGYSVDELEAGVDKATIAFSPNTPLSFDSSTEQAEVILNLIHWNSDGTKIIPTTEITNYRIEWYQYRRKLDILNAIEYTYTNHIKDFLGLSSEECDLLRTQKINNIGCTYINDDNWQLLTDYSNLYSCYMRVSPEAYNTEQIRAFVFIDDNTTPIQSNILSLSNSGYASTDQQHTGVVLVPQDNSFGNYYYYTSNAILNNEDKKTRVLKLYYYDSYGEVIDILNSDQFSDQVDWNYPEDDTMLSCIKSSNPTELLYTIKSYYTPGATNNTISATIHEQNSPYTEYTGTYDFNFGQSGISTANRTLIIDFEDLMVEDQNINYTRNAIQVDESTASFKLKMFDYNNQEVDVSNVEWNILVYDATTGNQLDNEWYQLTGTSSVVNITFIDGSDKDKFNFDHMLVLKASTTVNDESISVSYPIAISKDLKEYNHITGASSVIYKTIGTPIYDDSPYAIYKYNDITTTSYVETDNLQWKLVGSQTDDNIGVTGLKPLALYMNDNESTIYGALCTKSGDEEENIWLQPIITLQTQFSSTTINNWNGTEVEINEEEGTIVSPLIASGTKDDDGKFSGIIMGGIKSLQSDGLTYLEKTGLYGYGQDQLSFGFIEDGTAFIGKENSSRILFDGNESTITSSLYINNNQGIKLDLDDALFNAQNNNYYVTIDVTSGNLQASDKALKIGNETIEKPPNFYVTWEGKMYATEGTFSGTIEAEGGHIGGWTISETALYYGDDEESSDFILSPSLIKFGEDFQIDEAKNLIITTNHFSIDAEGNLTIKDGAFSLVDDKLTISTENFSLDEYGNLTIIAEDENGDSLFQISDHTLVIDTDNFYLDEDGNLTIKSANNEEGDPTFQLDGNQLTINTDNLKLNDKGLTITSANLYGNLNLNTNSRLNGVYGVLNYKVTGKSIGKKKGKTFRLYLATILKDNDKKSTIEDYYRPVAISKVWTNHSSACKLGGFNIVYTDDNQYIAVRLVNTGKALTKNLNIGIKILFLKTNATEFFGVPEEFLDTSETFGGTDSEEEDDLDVASVVEDDDGTTKLTPVYIEKKNQTFTKTVYMEPETYDTSNDFALATIGWTNDKIDTLVKAYEAKITSEKSTAYSDGYSNGYSAGYDAGYDAGKAAASTSS